MVSQLGDAHDKGPQRSNWLRRPLSEQQMHYAQQDVIGLQRLADHLEKKLRSAQRWEMTLSAGDEALERWCHVGPRSTPSVERLKAFRRADPAVPGRGQALLEWRESEGFNRNRPVRWLLSDDDLVALAFGRKEPSKSSQTEALDRSKPLPRAPKQALDGQQRAHLKVLKRQRMRFAERVEMDPSFLAPPALLNDLVLGRLELPDQGWRTPWLEQMLNEPTDPDPVPPEAPSSSAETSDGAVSSASGEDANSP